MKMMKGLLLMGLMSLGILGAESAWETAISTDIQGKGGWFTCLKYSESLYEKMAQNGHEAHFIIYEWKNESRTVGRHAFVVYKDEKGRYYGMDNRLQQPMWLEGKTPEEWVKFFAKGTQNTVICHYGDTKLIGFAGK